VAATGGLFLQILHAALLLAAAPLVPGLTRWARARLDGRRGPPPVQPYRDLLRALRRRPALAASASPFSAGAPLVAVGALALAAGLLPPVAFAGAAPVPFGPAPAGPSAGLSAAPPAVSGDLVLIAALFALSRFASALALLDAGTAAGGLGAARLLARPALFEPALLLVALCAATLAGAGASGDGGAPFGPRAPLLLAAAAVLLVAAAEAPRLPVAAGEGGPPHDLGDAPEAAGAEFSGWHSALWDYARALRSTLFLVLAVALLPGPPALAGTVGAVLRPVFGIAELALACLALAAVESGLAVAHPERLPALGVGALVLAAAAAALLLLGGAAA
jgi:formate hydrogenlyase subunit 4